MSGCLWSLPPLPEATAIRPRVYAKHHGLVLRSWAPSIVLKVGTVLWQWHAWAFFLHILCCLQKPRANLTCFLSLLCTLLTGPIVDRLQDNLLCTVGISYSFLCANAMHSLFWVQLRSRRQSLLATMRQGIEISGPEIRHKRLSWIYLSCAGESTQIK